ncbi:MAG: leucine-rich repeat protein [Acutalibacteraceae bacterium]
MLKKILSLILAGVILFSSGAVAFAADFAETTEDASVDATSEVSDAEELLQISKDLGLIGQEKKGNDPLFNDDLEEAIKIIRPDTYTKYVNAASNKISLSALMQRIWISAGKPIFDNDESGGEITNNKLDYAGLYCSMMGFVDNKMLTQNDEFINCSLAAEILLKYYFNVWIEIEDKVETEKKVQTLIKTKNNPDSYQQSNINSDFTITEISYCEKNDSIIFEFSVKRVTKYAVLSKKKLTKSQYESIMGIPVPANGEVLQGFQKFIIKRIELLDDLKSGKKTDNSLQKCTLNASKLCAILTGEENSDGANDNNNGEVNLDYNNDGEINLLDPYFSDIEKISVIFKFDESTVEKTINNLDLNIADLLSDKCENTYFYMSWTIDNITKWRYVNKDGNVRWYKEDDECDYGYYKDCFNPNVSLYNITSKNITFVKAEWTDSDSFDYVINSDNQTATITGYPGTGTEVIIPPIIDGYTVTGIDDMAFYGCSSVTSIIIPDSISWIGWSAFGDCTNLTSVIIGSGVISIDDYAFRDCTSLKNINVDSNNKCYTSVQGVLFTKDMKTLVRYPCAKIGQNYVIPSSVTSVENGAFEDCINLTSISLSDNLKRIGDCAFAYCKSLKNISIAEGTTRIGNCAFSGCTDLVSVSVPNSVTSIGVNAFDTKKTLTVYCYKNSCTERYAQSNNINYKCFTPASDFKYTVDEATKTAIITGYPGTGAEVIIPPSIDGYSVTGIDNSAFNCCEIITSVILPSSITKIGSWAFNYCKSLKRIDVFGDSNYYTSIDGVLFTKDKKTIVRYPCAKEGKEYIIPSGVKKIYDSCFNDTSLVSITIPYGVTNIGSGAFLYSDSLTSINLPTSLKNIGDSAFLYCKSLTSIDIPKSVTSIGHSAFASTGLTSITIPDSVTSIETSVFAFCKDLESVTIPDSVTSISEWAFYESYYVTIYCNSGSYAESYAKSNSINYKCFTPASDFKYTKDKSTKTATITGYPGTGAEVIIPPSIDGYSVTGIGDSAFRDCTSLENIFIPESVKSMGMYALYGCTNLKNITIPERLINKGDADLDGKITSYDVNLIEDHLDKISTLNSVQRKFADVDGDEEITENDTLTISKYFWGLICTIDMSKYTTYAIGDVDGDGVVTADDKALIEKYLNNQVILDENQINAADVDKDGKVTISDSTAIEKYASAVAYLTNVMSKYKREPAYYDEERNGYIHHSYINRLNGDYINSEIILHKCADYQYSKGDVDGDGRITVRDAILVQKCSLLLMAFDNDSHKNAADVNDDGKADIVDATIIQKCALGITVKYLTCS